jgi:hypothetical protein
MVQMMNGIMRSSEIAAWHAGAAACLSVSLTLSAKSARSRWLGALLFVVFVVVVLLTGRRKMLAAIVLFVLIFLFLLARYGGGAGRFVQLLAGGGALMLVAASWLGRAEQEIGFGSYLSRGGSILQDSSERVVQLTLSQFGNIVQRNGLFGSGTGTGAQGAQYFGGGSELVGGAAEGGLGKVLAELGLPGALALLWLALELGRTLLGVAARVRLLPRDLRVLLVGIVAFLPANAAVFLSAHQVFGDPFVLIVLGWITGALLAFPALIEVHARETAAGKARVLPNGNPARAGARR